MATKSTKVPAKKTVSRPTRAKLVVVEVAPEIPDLVSFEIEGQISKVRALIAKESELSERDLADGIRSFAERADGFSKDAVTAGASAVVYAWACGKLLNTAKRRMGRGDFGTWRDEKLGVDAISERTSQRYMQLAKQHDDVRGLLEWSPTLRQAYIACGILPEPPEREPGDEDSDEVKRQALLSSITGMQKRLRLFAGLKGRLGAAEKTQLRLAKREIDGFFDQILG